MAEAPLLTALRMALALLGVAAYWAVGRAVSHRPVSTASRLAKHSFEVWWYGLAGLTLTTPLLWVMDRAGVTDLTLLLTIIQGVLVLLVVAVAGLVYYLLYLYIGKRSLLPVVAVYFFALLSWL